MPDAGHQPSELLLDQHARGMSEVVAVVRVELRGERAAPFVAEIVGLRGELRRFVQLAADQLDQKLLGLDLRDLDVAVRVAVEQQLVRDAFGQEVQQRL